MNREKTIQKKFYVDDIEDAIIKRKMSEANLSNFSIYARLMLTTGKINVIDFEALRKLRYEINKIGVNINQIAKLANENQHVYKTDIQQIMQYQKHLEKEISKLIKQEIKEVE